MAIIYLFFPLTGGCSEGLDAFRFFFIHSSITVRFSPIL